MKIATPFVRLTAASCVVAALALDVSAQTETPPKPAPIVVPRVGDDLAPKLDGKLDDALWKTAAPIEKFYETVFGDNREPSVKTRAYVAYDAKYLYVGVFCSDPDPSKIRAPFADRDQVVGTDDNVALFIETAGDKRVAQEFRVSPRGIQGDAVFNDASGNEDFSPDFYYDTAAQIVTEGAATGWSAEFRIPFSSLRFKPEGEQKWGIMVWRNYPRDRRYAIYSAPVPRDNNCYVCNLHDITGFTDLPKSRHMVIAPYAAGQDIARAPRPGGDLSGDGFDPEFGLDFKWTPFTNMAIDLTLNPDFSQVEADVAQIGVNNRFALFFPEKRPFFLEGTDLLESPIQAFYSRSITSPKFGARVTGSARGTGYTILLAQDQGGGSVILPGPEFSDFAPQDFESTNGVFRARKELGTSYIGALATLREIRDEDGGGHNRVAGVDFQWRPSGGDRVLGQFLASDSRTPNRQTLAAEWTGVKLTDRAFQIGWARVRPKYDFSVRYDDAGSDFRADLGFIPQVGFQMASVDVGYRLFPKGFLSFARPQAFAEYVTDHDGEVINRAITPLGIFLTGKKNLQLFSGLSIGEFRTSGRLLTRTRLNYFVQVDPSRTVSRIAAQGYFGEDIDLGTAQVGNGGAVNLSAQLRPDPHVTINLNSNYSWLGAKGGPRLFSAQVQRVKATYNASARAFLRLIGQYTTNRRYANGLLAFKNSAFSGSVLLSYRLNWQTALFIGYGDDRGLSENDRLERVGRQFFTKISYSFQR